MDRKTEAYESPDVLTFAELDFEPMVNGCTTAVTCDGAAGGCPLVFVFDNFD